MFCSAWIVNEKNYIICPLFLVLLPLIFLPDKNALFFFPFGGRRHKYINQIY